MRRRQHGSVAFFVIVAIIAAVAWWQRGKIASFFSRAGAPPAVVAEVSGVSCTILALGDAVMSGTVKNVSGEAQSLELTARWDIEDLKPMYFYSPLNPLQAGASTQFEVRGVLPQGAKGTCRVQAFTDRKTAKPVGFR